MYVGISSDIISDKAVEIGFSIHDGGKWLFLRGAMTVNTHLSISDFSIDYSVQGLILNDHPSLCAQQIEDFIVGQLEDFSEKQV